jgi:hypothetical protein
MYVYMNVCAIGFHHPANNIHNCLLLIQNTHIN